MKRFFSLLLVAFVFLAPSARADCSLTTTGNVPLPDLGAGEYQGFVGGLYPGGSNIRPAAHEAAGLAEANQIKPLDASGASDNSHGLIGLISVGMSNTTDEFASGGPMAFKPRADADPSKDPKVTIVDGAQGGKDAAAWADPNDSAWSTLAQRLSTAGVASAQVQVAWVKLALEDSQQYGAFPASAQVLQADVEAVLRTLKARYPKLQIAYLSSRTRAYTNDPNALSPEPDAYETGFAVQWTIADQINGTGNLNFDSTKGAIVAPYLSWGPYLWADGTNPRSDGFTWLCSDLQSDFIHPSDSGVEKVGTQLLTFFKTDPTASPWFLKQTTVSPPTVIAAALPAGGAAGVSVQFSANVTPTNGIASYSWIFDDGTFSDSQNPIKTFPTAGNYIAYLTVTTDTGDFVTTSVHVDIGMIPSSLLNVSTRLEMSAGEQVAIGGFIVTGNGTKQVLVRAIGPSLAAQGVTGLLTDPYLELHDSTGALIASNDNWETTQIGGVITADQAKTIRATTIAPTDSAEAAILAQLNPGSYTAVMSGTGGGSGVGLVEVYDLDQGSPATIANLSTRGSVQSGANVLIGGFIIGGSEATTVVVRALGPSLSGDDLSGVLADPTLELHNAEGAIVASNDNWADTQQAAILAAGLAPSNAQESAIESALEPGSYTAIVAGKNGGMGIGLVEVYKIQ
jgi:PKD repeat protein